MYSPVAPRDWCRRATTGRSPRDRRFPLDFIEEHKVLVTDEGELPNLPEGMKRATEDEMFQPADAPRVRSSFIVFWEEESAKKNV